MDNETPNYAKWIPEAGGYVSNGRVLSKSPVYDENGKAKIVVDASTFGNTNLDNSKVQVANNPISNNGITTANKTGSGQDANSLITNLGSFGSLNLNTTNPEESVISSPATKSPIAGSPVLTIEDKINQDYLQAAARNDYQGMINALVEMGDYNGQDYSQQIDTLTQQREQKIMVMDNQYLAKYNEASTAYQQAQNVYNNAIMQGDAATAEQAQTMMNQAEGYMNQIAQQQDAWRGAVDYTSAVRAARARDLQKLDIEYKTTYMDGVNQMTNAILQLTGNYLNFQYDPTQDAQLIKAQDQVTLKMRNLYNKTGMFYSTASQYAITSAVAELVPIYEKMAKEEMLQQINLLKSTAEFLLGLEETQFNMWKTQVQFQFDANAEKRAQFKQALEASNARGYVNNEEAAILGVAPGSPSQKAREHEQELQEQLDAEARELQQKMVLDKYKSDLELENYKEKAKIDAYYDSIIYENRAKIEKIYSNNGGSGSNKEGIEVTQVIEKDGTKTTIKRTVYSDGKGGFVDADGNPVEGILSESSTTILPSKLKNEDGTWNDTEVKKYIFDDLSELSQAEQADIITDLVYEYAFDKIDNYYETINDKSKAKNAVTSAYNDIERFAGWVEGTGLSNDQKLLAVGIATDRLANRVDQAEFAPEIKTKVMKELVKAMDKSSNTTIRAAADNYSKYRESTAKPSTNTNRKPTTTNTTSSTEGSGKKVYVNQKIPDSSYPSVADKKAFAKRLGYEYDEEKDKMYYYN